MDPVLCADTHCHLDDPAFDADLPEVLRRALVAGIHPIVAPAESLASTARILEIAGQYPCVLPCVGVHPHKAAFFETQQKSEFESYAARPEVVAIGEVGLDYFYEHSDRDKQIVALSFFLDLASRRNLPACIHVRDKSGRTGALNDLLALIKPLSGHLRGVVHCFSGTYEEAKLLLDQGMHLSFTGILTFKTAEALRDVFARLPEDRILLETDAPYLAPVPLRGKRNEPSFARHIFELAASVRRLQIYQWSDRLRETQKNLFGPRCAWGASCVDISSPNA